MRILVLPLEFPSDQRPYAGIFILRRVQALRELGHDISVVRMVPHAPPFGRKWRSYRSIPAAYEMEGIPVRTIRAVIPPRRLGLEFLPFQVTRALQAEIARFKPDVLHASFLIPCGQIAVRQHLVPTVVTAHGGDAYSWPKQRPGLLRAAREAVIKAGRVTAVSGYIAQCVRSIAERDVDVIWNGGDERFFYPRDRAKARVELGLPPDRFIIAFAGNVLRAKGVFDLIEAVAGLPELSPLVVVGGMGEDEAALQEYAAHERVELRMLGRLTQDRIACMMGAADVMTLPSYNEGLPNVVCEAMLSGRAMIATTVGGTPEIISDRRSGILIQPGDPGALRAALAALASDSRARARIEQAARDFAAANLTWRISARRYQDVLQQARTSVP